MVDRIKQLVDQIKQLDNELRTELQKHENTIPFELKGKKVVFSHTIKQTHLKLKTGIWTWFFGIGLLNIITAPIIYAMIIPLIISDIFISFYQFSCFPIYKISKVRRSDYIVFDHQHLAYLNFFERLHCLYCSYANGLNSYIREILSKTEQYFCPIKHAHHVLGAHHRYSSFIAYGDAENYHQRLQALRKQLSKEQ